MATPTPVFPVAVATDANLKVANNQIQTTLSVQCDSVNTILFVASTAGFVTNCLISIDKEIIAVASVVASPNPQLIVATGGRGFDGTSAAPHAPGSKISMLIDAWHHNVLATEIKAIEGFLGPNGQNLTSQTSYVSTNYIFTPQQPGGSLIAGNNTITLSPVPKGVNGTDQAHYLYISGGTGAAEPVLITGGTAVSGAVSGTLIVNCANAHSGAWTIATATAGMQEAINAALAAGGGMGAVRVPAGSYTVYATTSVLPANQSLSLRGMGYQTTNIQSGNLAMNVFTFGGPNGMGLDFGDMSIYSNNGTAPVGVDISGVADGVVTNLRVAGQSTSIRARSTARFFMDNILVSGYSRGLSFASDPASLVTQSSTGEISNIRVISPTGATGVVFEPQVSGITVTGLFTEGGAYAVRVLGNSPAPVNEVTISNFILDSYTLVGFDLLVTDAGSVSNRVALRSGMLASTGTVDAASYAIRASASLLNQIKSLSLEDIDVAYQTNNGAVAGSGILLGGVNSVNIDGVSVRSGDGHGNGVELEAPGSSNVSITGSRLGVNVDGQPTGAMSDRGVVIGGSPHSYVHIDGCVLGGTYNRVLNNSTDTATVEITANNRPLDLLTIASAAAFPVPAFPQFFVSGNVAVTGVTGLGATQAGRSGMFVCTHATPGTWTAGATIGNTLTPLSGVPVNWFWDGTKIWLK